jgi:hypothetical protein
MMSLVNQPEDVVSRNPLLNPDLRELIFSFFGPRDAHVAVASKSFEASYRRCINPAALAATGSRSPLLDAGLRGVIFSYVGAGHWLFLGLVSKGFKESYQTVEQCEVMAQIASPEACDTEAILCSPKMTLMRAVVESPTRFRLAVDSGLLQGRNGDPAGNCCKLLVSLATSALYKQPSWHSGASLSYMALRYLDA